MLGIVLSGEDFTHNLVPCVHLNFIYFMIGLGSSKRELFFSKCYGLFKSSLDSMRGE